MEIDSFALAEGNDVINDTYAEIIDIIYERRSSASYDASFASSEYLRARDSPFEIRKRDATSWSRMQQAVLV